MQAFLQFMKDNKKEAILSDDLFKKGLRYAKSIRTSRAEF